MSVLTNSTHFNITNNTSKFLEIAVSVDQQSSFRIHHTSAHIIEVPRKTAEHSSYASWFVDTATCWTRGKSMEMGKINMPPKKTIECDISCSGGLELTTAIKERNSMENTFDPSSEEVLLPQMNFNRKFSSDEFMYEQGIEQ